MAPWLQARLLGLLVAAVGMAGVVSAMAPLWRSRVAAVERLLSPQITPPGTQPGAVLRVGGKGLPRVKGKGRGDLYMSIAVRIPEHVNEQERRLYEQLRGGAVPPVGGSG